eukprot:9394356-Pyramimonas_sp.AAC.1
MNMGPPWIKYDSMTESLRSLYVVEGLTETFSEQWGIHKRWVVQAHARTSIVDRMPHPPPPSE